MTRAKRKSKPKSIAPAAEELQQLADLGITDAQLARCRFSPRHTACPLDERAILLDPTIPEEHWVRVFPLVRLPLIRRITLSNDPADIAYWPAAWTEIGLAEMQPLIKEALNSRAGNRDRARLPRKSNYIPSLEKTMVEVIQEFSDLRENRAELYRDLWRRFYAHLDSLDLDVEEIEGQYEYNAGGKKRRPISFLQFRRQVHLARKATGT